MAIHKIYLYPNGIAKTGWAKLDGQSTWEETSEPGVLEPTTPSILTGMKSPEEGGATHGAEMETWTRPEGIKIIHVRAHCYCKVFVEGPTNGFYFAVNGELGVQPRFAVTSSVAEWRSIDWEKDLKQSEINALTLKAACFTSNKSYCYVYKWYIELEYEEGELTHRVEATLPTSGLLDRNTVHQLAAKLTMVGKMSLFIKFLEAVLKMNGALNRKITHSFAAELSLKGTLRRTVQGFKAILKTAGHLVAEVLAAFRPKGPTELTLKQRTTEMTFKQRATDTNITAKYDPTALNIKPGRESDVILK